MPAVSNAYTVPRSLPLVSASILAADFAELGADAGRALEAGADGLHVDVMDGHFVPNLTMGPVVVRSLRRAMPDAFLDVHLMVTDPRPLVRPFADAGADHLTFHVEVVTAPGDVAALVDDVHASGMTAGLAVNPPTELEAALPAIEHVDLVLIMSVHPGFAGQAFEASVLDKARRVKPALRGDQRLAIDGGVNPATVAACRDAGCDVLVAASAIFRTDDYGEAIETLRGAPRLVSGSC